MSSGAASGCPFFSTMPEQTPGRLQPPLGAAANQSGSTVVVPGWDDDNAMRGRFRLFRGGDEDYSDGVNFWTTAIVETARARNLVVINAEEVRFEWFRRKGVVPLGIDFILEEMLRTGRLRRPEECHAWCQSQLQSWPSWLMASSLDASWRLLRSSVSWAMDTAGLLSAAGADGMAVHGELVVMDVLRNLADAAHATFRACIDTGLRSDAVLSLSEFSHLIPAPCCTGPSPMPLSASSGHYGTISAAASIHQRMLEGGAERGRLIRGSTGPLRQHLQQQSLVGNTLSSRHSTGSLPEPSLRQQQPQLQSHQLRPGELLGTAGSNHDLPGVGAGVCMLVVWELSRRGLARYMKLGFGEYSEGVKLGGKVTRQDTRILHVKCTAESVLLRCDAVTEQVNIASECALKCVREGDRRGALWHLARKRMLLAMLESCRALHTRMVEVLGMICSAEGNKQVVDAIRAGTSAVAADRMVVEEVEDAMSLMRAQMDELAEVNGVLANSGSGSEFDAEIQDEFSRLEQEARMTSTAAGQELPQRPAEATTAADAAAAVAAVAAVAAAAAASQAPAEVVRPTPLMAHGNVISARLQNQTLV